MNLPSLEALKEAWEELCHIHRRYLAIHDVYLPVADREDRQRYSRKWIWLSVLYIERDRFVHKDEVSEVVRWLHPDAAADQQVRHLKRDGWNIIPDPNRKGAHRLDPFRPSPEWETTAARRRGRLTANSFDDLKTNYANQCATCGAQEGFPHPRYAGNEADPVELQQGRQDPEKPYDLTNVIPQCQFCNRAYKDDFVFDARGRIRAIASIRPVQRASVRTRQRVKAWLLGDDQGDMLL